MFELNVECKKILINQIRAGSSISEMSKSCAEIYSNEEDAAKYSLESHPFIDIMSELSACAICPDQFLDAANHLLKKYPDELKRQILAKTLAYANQKAGGDSIRSLLSSDDTKMFEVLSLSQTTNADIFPSLNEKTNAFAAFLANPAYDQTHNSKISEVFFPNDKEENALIEKKTKTALASALAKRWKRPKNNTHFIISSWLHKKDNKNPHFLGADCIAFLIRYNTFSSIEAFRDILSYNMFKTKEILGACLDQTFKVKEEPSVRIIRQKCLDRLSYCDSPAFEYNDPGIFEACRKRGDIAALDKAATMIQSMSQPNKKFLVAMEKTIRKIQSGMAENQKNSDPDQAQKHSLIFRWALFRNDFETLNDYKNNKENISQSTLDAALYSLIRSIASGVKKADSNPFIFEHDPSITKIKMLTAMGAKIHTNEHNCISFFRNNRNFDTEFQRQTFLLVIQTIKEQNPNNYRTIVEENYEECSERHALSAHEAVGATDVVAAFLNCSMRDGRHYLLKKILRGKKHDRSLLRVFADIAERKDDTSAQKLIDGKHSFVISNFEYLLERAQEAPDISKMVWKSISPYLNRYLAETDLKTSRQMGEPHHDGTELNALSAKLIRVMNEDDLQAMTRILAENPNLLEKTGYGALCNYRSHKTLDVSLRATEGDGSIRKHQILADLTMGLLSQLKLHGPNDDTFFALWNIITKSEAGLVYPESIYALLPNDGLKRSFWHKITCAVTAGKRLMKKDMSPCT